MPGDPRPITPNLGQRPLSPHLSIYRFGWTMAFSIGHRILGVALSVGTLLLVYWLVALAEGPESYARAQALLGHWFGRLVLFGWTFALFFHLCNGIRHLCWDAGWGLDMKTARMTAWGVLTVAVLLTLFTWSIGYGLIGGG